MKRIFLIDFENTHIYGLNGIGTLKNGDKIIVFHSNDKMASTLSGILTAYLEKGVEIEFRPLNRAGKNNLDFMISVQLGWEAREKRVKKEIVIISNDQGFWSAVNYAMELNPKITVCFATSIENYLLGDVKKTDEKDQNKMEEKSEFQLKIQKELSEVFKRFSIKESKAKTIEDFLLKSTNKKEINLISPDPEKIKIRVLSLAKEKEIPVFEELANEVLLLKEQFQRDDLEI